MGNILLERDSMKILLGYSHLEHLSLKANLSSNYFNKKNNNKLLDAEQEESLYIYLQAILFLLTFKKRKYLIKPTEHSIMQT